MHFTASQSGFIMLPSLTPTDTLFGRGAVSYFLSKSGTFGLPLCGMQRVMLVA